MMETTIQFRSKDEWPPGMTMEKIRAKLAARLKLPGLSNAWVMPIRIRIDMLATEIKTPVGIKISGPALTVLQSIGQQLETTLKQVLGTTSVFAERMASAHYVTIDIDRIKAVRYGLNIQDIQEVIETAVGGMNVTQPVEGRERHPVNMRYLREIRDSLDKLRLLPIVTLAEATIPLREVANVEIAEGPNMIRSENAHLDSWVYVDMTNRDLDSYVQEAQRVVNIKLPAGYSITWSGQYEYLERTKERLSMVAPFTLAIIFLLLYLNFRRFTEVMIILATLPLALASVAVEIDVVDARLSQASFCEISKDCRIRTTFINKRRAALSDYRWRTLTFTSHHDDGVSEY